MKAEIRAVETVELDRCAAVLRAGFADPAAEFGLTPENCRTNAAFMQADWLRVQHERGNAMYGLYVEGELCGFAQWQVRRQGGAELKNLCVLPACRHAGYGKQLVRHCMEAARAAGQERMHIGIIQENVRLRAWYEGCSFVHTGTAVFEHLPFTVGYMECAL